MTIAFLLRALKEAAMYGFFLAAAVIVATLGIKALGGELPPDWPAGLAFAYVAILVGLNLRWRR